MQVTIVNEGKMVGVDGEFYHGLPFELAPTIHAVQWNGTWGEIEHQLIFENERPIKPANTTITSFSDFDFVLPVWQAAKDADLAARAAALASEAAQSAEQPPTQP